MNGARTSRPQSAAVSAGDQSGGRAGRPTAAGETPVLQVERTVIASLLRGNPAAALKVLGGVKSAGTSQPELDNLRGLALMLNGDVNAALPLFEKALPLPEARFNRAVALLKLARYVEASSEFEKLYADSPFRASAAYHDALALDALGKTNDAVTWLTRALDLDPNFDSAMLYLGIMRERLGDLQGAGKAYKQFLDRHPDSIVAMLRFGVAAQRSGHPETARKYFDKIVAAAPSSPEAAEARMYLEMWSE